MASLADVLEAARQHGWRVGPGRFPEEVFLDKSRDLPTPGWVSRRHWSGEVYLDLRQVVLLVFDGRLSASWIRTGTPWTGATEQRVSAVKAIEYLQNPEPK